MKNNSIKSILIIFTVLFIVISSQGVFAQEQVDWNEYETKHFIIKYHDLDESTLSMIAEEAENAYDKVTSDLRYQPDNKTIIRIGPEETRDYEWQGSYSIGWNRIDLQSTTQRRWYFFRDYESYIEEAIVHEFTHHILSEGYKMRFPEWLNEGIATYEAKKKIEDFAGYRQFRNAAAKDKLLSLGKMGIFDLLEDDEIPLAYVESYTVIEYIVNTYGHDKLVEILKAKRENKHMDQITDEVLGVSYGEFKLAWMNFVKEKYGEPYYGYYLSIIFYILVWVLLLKIGKRIWTKITKN